jgi:hypothetical protein
MSEASERALLEILEYLRAVLDDPRCKDEAWLELEPRPHLRAELRTDETGEPPASLPCEVAQLEDLVKRRLIYRRKDARDRLSITPQARDVL